MKESLVEIVMDIAAYSLSLCLSLSLSLSLSNIRALCCMAGAMGPQGAINMVRDTEFGATAPSLSPQQHLGKLHDLHAREVCDASSACWLPGKL